MNLVSMNKHMNIMHSIEHNFMTYMYVYAHSECPEGFFGQDCLDECLCQNGAECDFITGMCNCTIGFVGALCDMSEFHARSTT